MFQISKYQAVQVYASAKSCNHYGADGLRVQVRDEDDNRIIVDADTLYMIKEQAVEELMEAQYTVRLA